MTPGSRAAIAAGLVLAAGAGAAVGASARPIPAAPAPAPTSAFEPLRILAYPQTAADRLRRDVGPRFVRSTSRLVSSPPGGGLYLVRDRQGRVCLLLADDDGRAAAACRAVAQLGRVPLTVRLIPAGTDGTRAGVEAELDPDGTLGWHLL